MKRFRKVKKDQRTLWATDKLCALTVALILVVVGLCGCTVADGDFDIKCAFLDAGQGDASLIMTSDGYNVMIDTGAPGSTDKVISSLLSYKVDRIDLLILTHSHEDHVAGTVEILERFEVKELWCLDGSDSYVNRSIEEAAKDNNTALCLADKGESMTLGESVVINVEVLCAYAEGEADNDNENSLIIRASYLDFVALYMADAGHKTEEYLLDNGFDISCDVLKVGHHGSDSSSSEDFIKAADPQVAIISCEKNNVYGHPHKKTLDMLEGCCEYIAYTYNGNFEVLVKGTQISFEKKN